MTISTMTRIIPPAILLAILASTPAFAATAFIPNAQVNRVMVHGDGFGGCMANLSVNPQSLLPGCGPGWVTFSCTGNFTDAVRAYRMLDQAQLALAANKNVSVVVDDSRKHNGYCFATRIDVIR